MEAQITITMNEDGKVNQTMMGNPVVLAELLASSFDELINSYEQTEDKLMLVAIHANHTKQLKAITSIMEDEVKAKMPDLMRDYFGQGE